jgi:subtilisin family serine protease
VLALAPSERALQAAQAAGFRVLRRERVDPLDLDEVVLEPPNGQSVRAAVRALRRLDPAGQYDYDHLYSPSGEAMSGGGSPVARGGDRPARAGLIDTGVEAVNPAFGPGQVRTEAFAPGGLKIDGHGTAVASLIAGRAPQLRAGAPGATLFAADVFGSGPTGGSADAIVHALAWMAKVEAPVINISLVGPPNRALEAAVRALIARGQIIVAPVGNDGPAAPPLYPASYPGVVAVTGIDPHGRILFEAGRASHVDFAAPGADLLAAQSGGGVARVRGTSFAAPIVTGRLALLLDAPNPDRAKTAVSVLASQARQIQGAGAARFGRGVVGEARRASR